MARGDLTDKYHRVCMQCGREVHVSAIWNTEIYSCEKCNCETFSRDKTTVGDI